MMTERQPSGQPDRRTGPGLRGGVFFKGLILFLAGAVFGMGALQTISAWRQGDRLKSARQRAEAVYAQVVPQLEVQLNVSQRLLEAWRDDLSQASVVSSASEIPWKAYATRQRQIETELDKASQGFTRLAGLTESLGATVTGREVLKPEHQEKLANLQAQYDSVRQGLRAAMAAGDWLRERRNQLALAEAEGGYRTLAGAAPADSEGVSPIVPAVVAERAASDAAHLTAAEAVRRMADVAERAQSESLQRAYLDAFQRLTPAATPAPALRYVPVSTAANAPLIIGQTYPDRYLGSRIPWNGYGYAPFGYGPYLCGPYGVGYGGFGYVHHHRPWRYSMYGTYRW